MTDRDDVTNYLNGLEEDRAALRALRKLLDQHRSDLYPFATEGPNRAETDGEVLHALADRSTFYDRAAEILDVDPTLPSSTVLHALRTKLGVGEGPKKARLLGALLNGAGIPIEVQIGWDGGSGMFVPRVDVPTYGSPTRGTPHPGQRAASIAAKSAGPPPVYAPKHAGWSVGDEVTGDEDLPVGIIVKSSDDGMLFRKDSSGVWTVLPPHSGRSAKRLRALSSMPFYVREVPKEPITRLRIGDVLEDEHGNREMVTCEGGHVDKELRRLPGGTRSLAPGVRLVGNVLDRSGS